MSHKCNDLVTVGTPPQPRVRYSGDAATVKVRGVGDVDGADGAGDERGGASADTGWRPHEAEAAGSKARTVVTEAVASAVAWPGSRCAGSMMKRYMESSAEVVVGGAECCESCAGAQMLSNHGCRLPVVVVLTLDNSCLRLQRRQSAAAG